MARTLFDFCTTVWNQAQWRHKESLFKRPNVIVAFVKNKNTKTKTCLRDRGERERGETKEVLSKKSNRKTPRDRRRKMRKKGMALKDRWTVDEMI